MKNNLMLLLLVVLFSCSVSFGQEAALMYSSRDAVSEDSIGVIRKIISHPWGNKLKVVYTNGKKRKIPENTVWGFRGRTGRLYRIYKGEVFSVSVRKDIVRYEQHVAGTNQIRRRYSTDLDAPLYWTKRKARRTAL